MKKEELTALVQDYGDATITYRSKNSRKLKYNVCTMDFNLPYIKSKTNRAKVKNNTEVLFFAWDTDSYRILDALSITSVVPLSATLKNENI